MGKKKKRNWFGIFICAMLAAFAALLCLKLCNAIGWSWIWVASPLWVIAAIFVLLFVLYTIVVAKNWDKEENYLPKEEQPKEEEQCEQ